MTVTEARLSTAGKLLRLPAAAPAVAGLVEVDADAVAAEIDDVGRAGAVDVGQPDAPLIEQVGLVEPRRASIVTLAPNRP